jgi:hypothetical protein
VDRRPAEDPSIGVAIAAGYVARLCAERVPDLGGFASITPCGIVGVEMTSVAREGGLDDIDGSATSSSALSPPASPGLSGRSNRRRR